MSAKRSAGSNTTLVPDPHHRGIGWLPEGTIQEARARALQLGRPIRFRFRGLPCEVSPDGFWGLFRPGLGLCPRCGRQVDFDPWTAEELAIELLSPSGLVIHDCDRIS